jgi:hypothetical protein
VTVTLLRALEHVHGHLGWLATAALAHPAILLRRPRRRALGAAAAATALVTAAAACGACLYPAYRTDIKPALFAVAPAIGYAFERKEHLAVAAVILSWAGLCLHWFNGRADPGQIHLGRAAFLAFVWATCLAATAAVLGTIVAITRTF